MIAVFTTEAELDPKDRAHKAIKLDIIEVEMVLYFHYSSIYDSLWNVFKQGKSKLIHSHALRDF